MSIKAFDLASCVTKIQPPVECLESCGKTLYVGTADSFILQYLIEEQHQPNGSLLFQCSKQNQKYLGLKKPINSIKAATALNRLLVLCDNTLYMLSTFDLEFIPAVKIKGVILFCVNEDPHCGNPFIIEICVARKRSLQVYHITENKAMFVQDVTLPETPSAMAMDGKIICIALLTKYAIVNYEDNLVQDVLPYDILVTKPLVIRISKGEFLLGGPNALGIFVTSERTSERPPLPWSENVKALAFVHPYILALESDIIVVYSTLDQKPKQRIHFNGGCVLDNFDGRIFAATPTSVFSLLPLPWENQVRSLLANKKVHEALELANHCHWHGLSKEQFNKIYRRLQQEAGFIELAEFKFDQAKDLFISGQLDPRELISLYPGILSSDNNFNKTQSSIHDIVSIPKMCQDDEIKIRKCRHLLLRYLEDIRESKNNVKWRKDVDVALLKLYAEENSSELTATIVASNLEGSTEECAQWLEKCHRYHALALFLDRYNDQGKALEVWVKLLDGKFEDENFQGLPFVIEYLANLKDYSLFWRYASVVLKKDEEMGVKIFTERPIEKKDEPSIRPDAVAEYLRQFPQALLKYLEYLIFVCDIRQEKFHTHLAVIYLEQLMKLKESGTDNEEQFAAARQKLQHMLRSSSHYRVHYLLGQIQNTGLHLETAILYGKIEEHDKALRILVHQLNDPQAARDYCQHYAQGRDLTYRQKIFLTLLGVYLDPQLEDKDKEKMCQHAICLLNSELTEFDAVAVLKLLPDWWSASVVNPFIMREMRKVLHTQRSMQVESNLAKMENIQTRLTQYFTLRNPIVISENSSCVACGGTFEDSEVVRYPNGDLTHPVCSKEIEKLSKSSTSDATSTVVDDSLHFR